MSDNSNHLKLDKMITGYWISQAIYAAAKLDVAGHLKNGDKTVDELAADTGTNSDALYRLLRALASVGVFSESKHRSFSLTALAELLRDDVPGSKRALALMSGDEQFAAWTEIEHSIRTGEKAFDKVFGQPIFDYLGEHPEKAKIFDAAMVGIHGRESNAVLDAYDFPETGVVVDIGGGNGSQIVGVLQKQTSLNGILFDLPHVVERAQSGIDEADLTDRCQLVGGSFFESVPAGGDLYMMRHIIHDWDEEKTSLILKNCHQAMSAESKLLVIESVISEGNQPFGGKFLDLVMLLIPGGKERTEKEYHSLFDQAGFRVEIIVPTSSEVSIIEVVKQ